MKQVFKYSRQIITCVPKKHYTSLKILETKNYWRHNLIKFISLILKNPFRNKIRSILSITGIAIGIATIIVLGLITGGLEESVQTSLHDGSAEITAMSANSTGFESTETIDSSMIQAVKNISGVTNAAGILTASDSNNTQNKGGNPPTQQSSISGIEPDKISYVGISSVNGSVYSNNTNEVIVGKTYAKTENKTIGDTITILGNNFKITGIYETGNFQTDSGVYTSLSQLQKIDNTTSVSQIAIKTDKNANTTKINSAIKDKYSDNITTTTAEERESQMSSITNILDTATYAISALAILIGSIGIINTMIMSVYERTREIGVLKSVGWTNKRVLTMILGETLVLTIVSAVVGIIAGIIIAEVGMAIINTDVLTLAYRPSTFILAFGVAIFVGIVGGVYPAYHASKLAPTEALRYE